MNRKKTDWAALLELGRSQVTGDDITILQFLAGGNSTPEIARNMGISRSMVWRTSQRLKKELEPQLASGES